MHTGKEGQNTNSIKDVSKWFDPHIQHHLTIAFNWILTRSNDIMSATGVERAMSVVNSHCNHLWISDLPVYIRMSAVCSKILIWERGSRRRDGEYEFRKMQQRFRFHLYNSISAAQRMNRKAGFRYPSNPFVVVSCYVHYIWYDYVMIMLWLCYGHTHSVEKKWRGPIIDDCKDIEHVTELGGIVP